MNIQEKTERAKQLVEFLANHHDAPKEEVIKALDELKTFIDTVKKNIDGARAKIEVSGKKN